MRGATVYLTQQEMKLILEALDLLELSYSQGEGKLAEQIKPTKDSLEDKLLKVIIY